MKDKLERVRDLWAKAQSDLQVASHEMQWDGRSGSVNVQRPAHWVKWRREADTEMRKHNPDKYGPVL